MSGTVAIVDYGLCNLDSVRRAVEECGRSAQITNRPADVTAADRVILPGVGAFPEAIANLRRSGLANALEEAVIRKGRPFLGICLGMQLIAARSLEVRPTEGFGWIDGEVCRIDPDDGVRVPHIGWNEVDRSGDDLLFENIPAAADFYFVHSYTLVPADEACVIGRTPYGRATIVSAVRRDNVWGVQFHPEKSQRVGFQVLRNFLAA